MTAPAHDGLIAGRYQLVAPIGSGGTASSSGRHRAAKERRLARGRPGSAAPSQRPRPQWTASGSRSGWLPARSSASARG